MRQVTAAVIIENERLFLARRAPDDNLAGLWELPGGKIEPGETPEACLQRELTEELEMDCVVHDLVASVSYEYQHGSFELLAYRTERRSGYRLRAHDRCAWVKADELRDFELAPADVAIVADLLSNGAWRP
jgi:8-oxo-dGTP diphosphatase